MQQTEDLNRRRKFDKTEHPSMFNLQNQRAHTPKMQSILEDFVVQMKRPVPFLPLGLDTKPYKAKKSRVRQKEMQQEADHRRA